MDFFDLLPVFVDRCKRKCGRCGSSCHWQWIHFLLLLLLHLLDIRQVCLPLLVRVDPSLLQEELVVDFFDGLLVFEGECHILMIRIFRGMIHPVLLDHPPKFFVIHGVMHPTFPPLDVLVDELISVESTAVYMPPTLFLETKIKYFSDHGFIVRAD